MKQEIETATPADAQAEQVQQVEQVEGSESTTEQPQETEQTQEEAEKKTPWFQKRISEVTREKYEAKRQADESAAEVQRLTEQLARFQAGDTEGDQPDVQKLARAEAEKIVAARSFDERCNKVHADGTKAFPDFAQSVSNLQMVGATPQFWELATESDAAAKLLHHLGQDLDEASRIASLPPVQMARELTKLEFKLAQAPAPKPVSKAPAPITPIGSGGTTTFDPAKLSDAEWHQRAYLKNRK
jgi:chromosome segregation ATPase